MTAATLRSFLRGPHVAICLVIVMLFLHLTRYRDLIAWRWPIVEWVMYKKRGPEAPIAKYRRFVLEREGGKREEVGLGRAAGFLAEPYRLDAGLRRDMPNFLAICLRELRRREGQDIVALDYERRDWAYQERTLAQHQAEPPTKSYRVLELVAPTAALCTASRAARNLVRNGDFAHFSRTTGVPDHFRLSGSWAGQAVSFTSEERAFVLGRSPAPQALSQEVALPKKLSSAPFTLRARVLARSRAPGASLELAAEGPAGESLKGRAEAPADDSWHLVELVQPMPEGSKGSVRISLSAPGKADAIFDDVALELMQTSEAP